MPDTHKETNTDTHQLMDLLKQDPKLKSRYQKVMWHLPEAQKGELEAVVLEILALAANPVLNELVQREEENAL